MDDPGEMSVKAHRVLANWHRDQAARASTIPMQQWHNAAADLIDSTATLLGSLAEYVVKENVK